MGFGDRKGYSAILLIVVGAIMSTISFVGFIGAYTDNPSLLKKFACLIGGLLLVQIVGIFVIYYTEILIISYEKDRATTMLWDSLQQEYTCCGVTEPDNWVQRYVDNVTVPDSCCKEKVLGCGKGALKEPDNSKMYLVGCIWQLPVVTLIASVGGILGILQLLGIFVAYYIARTSGGYQKANTNIELKNIRAED